MSDVIGVVESDSKPFNGDPNRSVGLNLAGHNAKSGVPRGVRAERVRGRGPNPTLGRALTMRTRSRTKVCLYVIVLPLALLLLLGTILHLQRFRPI